MILYDIYSTKYKIIFIYISMLTSLSTKQSKWTKDRYNRKTFITSTRSGSFLLASFPNIQDISFFPSNFRSQRSSRFSPRAIQKQNWNGGWKEWSIWPWIMPKNWDQNSNKYHQELMRAIIYLSFLYSITTTFLSNSG